MLKRSIHTATNEAFSGFYPSMSFQAFHLARARLVKLAFTIIQQHALTIFFSDNTLTIKQKIELCDVVVGAFQEKCHELMNDILPTVTRVKLGAWFKEFENWINCYVALLKSLLANDELFENNQVSLALYVENINKHSAYFNVYAEKLAGWAASCECLVNIEALKQTSFQFLRTIRWSKPQFKQIDKIRFFNTADYFLAAPHFQSSLLKILLERLVSNDFSGKNWHASVNALRAMIVEKIPRLCFELTHYGDQYLQQFTMKELRTKVLSNDFKRSLYLVFHPDSWKCEDAEELLALLNQWLSKVDEATAANEVLDASCEHNRLLNEMKKEEAGFISEIQASMEKLSAEENERRRMISGLSERIARLGKS